MSPPFPSADHAYHSLRDSESHADIFLCPTRYAYRQHICFGQLGASVLLASLVGTATFCASVGVVLGGGPEGQVPRSRVAAGRIIATVEDAHPVIALAPRDRPIRKFPSYTMGGECLPTKLESPVAVAVFRRGPFPAFVRSALIDLIPESLGIMIFSHDAPPSAGVVRVGRDFSPVQPDFTLFQADMALN